MLIKIFRRLRPRTYCPFWVGTLTFAISGGLPGGLLTADFSSSLSWRSPLSISSPLLAQTPPPEIAFPDSLDTNLDQANQSEEYDRLMQSGYAATQFREYDQALENFRAALALRPQDIYAQQAIFNVETYQAIQNRATVPFWLLGSLIGLGIVIVILMLRRGVIQSQQQFLTEVNQRQHESQDLQDRLRDQIFGAEAPKSNVTFNPRSPLVAAEDFPNSPNLAQTQETINANGQKVDWMAQLLADLKSPDPDRRRQAIWELARRGDSRAVPELSNLMTISDSQERDLILGALSQISGRTLRPISQALAASLRDQNPQVRRNAVRDLTRLHELMSQMNQLLTNATQDQDNLVKQTATKALQQYPPAHRETDSFGSTLPDHPIPPQPRSEPQES